MSKRYFVLLVLMVCLVVGLMALVVGCSLDEGPLSPEKAVGYPLCQRLIKEDEGGEITLGDPRTVKLSLKIDDDALSKDTVIGMGLPEPGKLAIDFYPDGLVFEDEVLLRVESHSIEIDDPASVVLYHYHADTGEWEPMDTKVRVQEGDTVTIEAEITHFSRYAFAGSE